MTLPRLGLVLVAALAAVFALGAGPARAATTLPAGFEEHQLATDFSAPGEDMIVDVAWAPDGRMFVADRAGMVFVHNPGDPPDTHAKLLDISDHVNNGPQTDRGLLGIAVDKDFASNGYLYLLYTYDKDTTDDNDWQVSTLTRVTVHPDDSVAGGSTDPTETRILGQIPSTFGNDPNVGVCGAPSNTNDCIPSEGASHSIGTVRVAPDGTLFVGTGDGNDYTIVDPLTFYDNDPETYRGKIMHIDRNGNGLPGHPFCAGDSNPADVCTKIYAEGLRNPFRFTLHPGGGLAIGDVGEDKYEEFDVAKGGEDFGWPCWEGNGRTTFSAGGKSYDTTSYCMDRYADPSDPHIAPIFAWAHVPYPINQADCNTNAPRGNTSIGGPTYMGDQYPAGYRGTTFFGDYMCQWVDRADLSGATATKQPFASGWDGGVDMEIAPDGNLAWIVNNEVREIVYAPGNHPPVVSPSASPAGGAAPLAVGFQAGGSDPDGDPVSYDWDFGDGSAHGAGASPSHTYAGPGSYVATVSADDGRGMTASASVPVTVTVTAGGTQKPRLRITRLRFSAGAAKLAARGVLSGSFSSRDAVKTFQVSLWRGRPFAKSCRWWSKKAHGLRRGSCKAGHWMKAGLRHHGTRYTWRLALGRKPGKGKYTLVLQALPRSSTLAPSARARETLRVR